MSASPISKTFPFPASMQSFGLVNRQNWTGSTAGILVDPPGCPRWYMSQVSPETSINMTHTRTRARAG